MHACMYVCIFMYLCMYVCIYVCMYVCMLTNNHYCRLTIMQLSGISNTACIITLIQHNADGDLLPFPLSMQPAVDIRPLPSHQPWIYCQGSIATAKFDEISFTFLLCSKPRSTNMVSLSPHKLKCAMKFKRAQ